MVTRPGRRWPCRIWMRPADWRTSTQPSSSRCRINSCTRTRRSACGCASSIPSKNGPIPRSPDAKSREDRQKVAGAEYRLRDRGGRPRRFCLSLACVAGLARGTGGLGPGRLHGLHDAADHEGQRAQGDERDEDRLHEISLLPSRARPETRRTPRHRPDPTCSRTGGPHISRRRLPSASRSASRDIAWPARRRRARSLTSRA